MDESQTNQIVNSEKSLIGLREYFGSGLDALRYFAEKMSNRFGREAVGEQCCWCKRESVTRVHAFRWRALVSPRFAFTHIDALMFLLGNLSVTIRHTTVDFVTYHGLCESCGEKTKLCRFCAVAIKSISFFLLLVCLGLCVFGGGAALLFWSDPKSRKECLTGFLIGVVGLIASVFGHIWERNLRIPKFVRSVGRKPFDLAKVVVRYLGDPT